VKIIEHSHRMLGLFSCGEQVRRSRVRTCSSERAQVWITAQNALLIYTSHGELVRQIKRPHDDTTRAVALVTIDAGVRVWTGAGDRTLAVWRVPAADDVVPSDALSRVMSSGGTSRRSPTMLDLSAVARGHAQPSVVRDGLPVTHAHAHATPPAGALTDAEARAATDRSSLDALDTEAVLLALKDPISGLALSQKRVSDVSSCVW
jgi:hypothetical protein